MDYNPCERNQMPTRMIKLQSSDSEIFQVEVKVAQMSLHLKEMLDDLGFEENEVISIPQNGPKISGAVMRKILEWANHHVTDPAVAENDETEVKQTDDVSIWDADFLQVDLTTLFQMINAANYLNIKGLLDVTCKTVASMIKGMTPEEVRQKFHIQNDFSPDEEEQVSRVNALCKDEVGPNAEMVKSVSSSVVDSIPADFFQNIGNGNGQDIEDCLSNSLIVKKILEHFSDTELLSLSFVNKMWNYEARSVTKKRGKLCAHVRCTERKSCQENIEAFFSAPQMNIVPFSGINIYIFHTLLDSRMDESANEFPEHFHGINLDQLQLKKFSLSAIRFQGTDNCAALQLAKKLLHTFREDLEELSFESVELSDLIEQFVQEIKFPRLRVLKLGWIHLSSFKELVSGSPRLSELHTRQPINEVFNALQGSSAVIVYTRKVEAPFDEILDAYIGAIRLEEIQLFYTGPAFNLERFSRLAPVLLQASGSSALRRMSIDAALAVPLMCYRVSLEMVEELQMNINYSQLEELEPEILRIVKDFDFFRIFPKLRKVQISHGDHYAGLSPDHLSRILMRADAVLMDPKPDRAANIKELHFNCENSNVTVQFFAEMFPSVEELRMYGAPEEIPFESIWSHWVDLKEIFIMGGRPRDFGNLDSAFCGIFPEEVAELMQKDYEFLKKVHIVPVKPAITCLKNLRVLSLYGFALRRHIFADDGTFIISKVTGLTAFARMPCLAVNFKFCGNGLIKATMGVMPFASAAL